MNLISKIKITLTITLFCISKVYSQSSRLDTNNVAQFANEVFLNCMQYTTPEHLDLYKIKLLKVEIIKIDDKQLLGKTINNITSLKLKNKCNTMLKHDDALSFSVQTFNPLKYFFPKSEEPTYYKIDAVNQIIKVYP